MKKAKKRRRWWVTVCKDGVIHDSFGSKADALLDLAMAEYWAAAKGVTVIRVEEVLPKPRRKR